jgi:hypothetical protein
LDAGGGPVGSPDVINVPQGKILTFVIFPLNFDLLSDELLLEKQALKNEKKCRLDLVACYNGFMEPAKQTTGLSPNNRGPAFPIRNKAWGLEHRPQDTQMRSLERKDRDHLQLKL